MISQSRLKYLLDYDRATGIFTRKVKSSNVTKVGAVANRDGGQGYQIVSVDRSRYLAHRLAWLFVYGELPDGDIDHINGDRNDNRIENLRMATRKQNMENQKLRDSNSTGYRGVSFRKDKNKYEARAKHNGKDYRFGVFQRAEDAATAVRSGRDLLFTHHKTNYSA